MIIFSEKIQPRQSEIAKIPELYRKQIASNIQSTKFSFKQIFNKKIVDYTAINLNTEIKEKILLSSSKTIKTYSNGTNIKASNIKIRKDILHNTITKVKDNKYITTKIKNVKWSVTRITKKILNFNCTLAKTSFKGKPLEVYFTKEIKGIASPYIYPFINGIILEYKTPTRHGIATDIKFNQPDIVEKDFFKS